MRGRGKGSSKVAPPSSRERVLYVHTSRRGTKYQDRLRNPPKTPPTNHNLVPACDDAPSLRSSSTRRLLRAPCDVAPLSSSISREKPSHLTSASGPVDPTSRLSAHVQYTVNWAAPRARGGEGARASRRDRLVSFEFGDTTRSTQHARTHTSHDLTLAYAVRYGTIRRSGPALTLRKRGVSNGRVLLDEQRSVLPDETKRFKKEPVRLNSDGMGQGR